MGFSAGGKNPTLTGVIYFTPFITIGCWALQDVLIETWENVRQIAFYCE